MLAQIYVLTCYNRIEAVETSYIKEAQKNLVSVLPTVLIEALKHKINHGQQVYFVT